LYDDNGLAGREVPQKEENLFVMARKEWL